MLGVSLMLNPGPKARTQTQFQAYTELRFDRSVITSLPAMNVSKQLELLGRGRSVSRNSAAR